MIHFHSTKKVIEAVNVWFAEFLKGLEVFQVACNKRIQIRLIKYLLKNFVCVHSRLKKSFSMRPRVLCYLGSTKVPKEKLIDRQQ